MSAAATPIPSPVATPSPWYVTTSAPRGIPSPASAPASGRVQLPRWHIRALVDHLDGPVPQQHAILLQGRDHRRLVGKLEVGKPLGLPGILVHGDGDGVDLATICKNLLHL